MILQCQVLSHRDERGCGMDYMARVFNYVARNRKQRRTLNQHGASSNYNFTCSCRPVIDYNQIALHFIECIYMHLKNTKSEVGGSASTLSTLVTGTPLSNGLKELHSQVSNQVSGQNRVGGSETDIYKLVLDVFQEPAGLANEHGLHVDEVVKRLGLPSNKIKEAIDYHVDVGHVYSTIDDYHFKSALID